MRISKNIEKLNNYSFTGGLISNGGHASIFTTIDANPIAVKTTLYLIITMK